MQQIINHECASVNNIESTPTEAQLLLNWVLISLGGDASRVLDLVTIIGSNLQQRQSG